MPPLAKTLGQRSLWLKSLKDSCSQKPQNPLSALPQKQQCYKDKVNSWMEVHGALFYGKSNTENHSSQFKTKRTSKDNGNPTSKRRKVTNSQEEQKPSTSNTALPCSSPLDALVRPFPETAKLPTVNPPVCKKTSVVPALLMRPKNTATKKLEFELRSDRQGEQASTRSIREVSVDQGESNTENLLSHSENKRSFDDNGNPTLKRRKTSNPQQEQRISTDNAASAFSLPLDVLAGLFPQTENLPTDNPPVCKETAVVPSLLMQPNHTATENLDLLTISDGQGEIIASTGSRCGVPIVHDSGECVRDHDNFDRSCVATPSLTFDLEVVSNVEIEYIDYSGDAGERNSDSMLLTGDPDLNFCVNEVSIEDNPTSSAAIEAPGDEKAKLYSGGTGEENADSMLLTGEGEINSDNDEDLVDDDPAIIAAIEAPRVEKPKTRKRQRHPDQWQKNIRKVNRRAGKAYVNSKGNAVEAKVMGFGCKLNCRKKCHQRITFAQRQKIFDNYYRKNTTLESSWYFMLHHVQRIKKMEETVGDESRRQYSYIYKFTVDGALLKVCKTMFLETLRVSHKVIETAYAKLDSSSDGTLSPCKIGKHDDRGNAVDPEVLKSVRDHIEKFPKVEAHYIRKDSSRDYVEEGWTISKMHRAYCKWMQDRRTGTDGEGEDLDYEIPVDALSDVTSDGELEDDEEALNHEDDEPEVLVKDPNIASYKLYLKIFNSEFNISPHKPKKDQCHLCCEYKEADPERKAQLQEQYDQHHQTKILLRAEKEKDRLATKDNPSLAFCCFDLQKVLYVPQGYSSGFFYNSKLSTYNFTVFEVRGLTMKKGYCFTWQEGICKKGSNEVASCLLLYIKEAVKAGVKEFRFYADNCTGQNKNKQVFALLVYLSALFHVKICLTFLQKGHTQNEGDSMHANIESASKGKTLYLPSHWRKIMRSAKVKDGKYIVVKLNQASCLDFKDLTDKQNWSKCTDGEDFKISAVRKVEVSDGENLKITYDILNEETVTLNVNQRKGRPVVAKSFQFKRAYNAKLPITDSTRKGLQTMCKEGTIPLRYQGFYRKLLDEHPRPPPKKKTS